jgi:hypothetical protein
VIHYNQALITKEYVDKNTIHVPTTHIIKTRKIIHKDKDGNKTGEITPKAIYIQCENLNPNHTYSLRLFTKQRGHGTVDKMWRYSA